MRVGTSLHAITDFGHDVKPFHEALADIYACGYETVMLLHRPGNPALTPDTRPDCCLLDLERSDPDTVRMALKRAGLAPVALHCGGIDVRDTERAEASAVTLRAAVDLAASLGIRIVIPNAGVAPAPQLPVADKEPLLRRYAELLTGGLADAPSKIRFAPDLHYGSVIETVADCGRLFDLVDDPRAGVTLNIGHLTTLRQAGWTIIRRYPERVHVVAWKDHLLEPPPEATHPVWSVELGRGDSPFERYIAALYHGTAKPEHLITFENVPLADKKAALRRSLVYWRALWA